MDIIKKAIERRDNTSETQKALPLPQEKQQEVKPEIPRIPQPQQEKTRTPAPSIDISALSMSTRGSTSHFSSRNDSSSMQPSLNTMQRPETKQEFSRPQTNERDTIMEIITNLKRKNPNGPLYMQNIISLANAKGVSEQKTRSLVSELKEEGTI